VLAGLLLSALVAAGPVPAPTASGGVFEGKPRVRATLVSDVTQVDPGGDFRLGVQLQMAKGWHVYWKNPGEAGLPSEVVWDAPRVALGPLGWPAPEVHRSPDGTITSYGYGGEVVLFARARAQPDVQPPLTVVATVEVLVCEVQCIPARFELTRVLGVGPRQADATGAALLDSAAARVPRSPSAAGLRVSLRRTTSFVPGQPFEGELTVERADGSPEPLAAGDAFVPERLPGIASVMGIPDGPGRLALWGKAALEPSSAPPRVAGVVALASGGALEVSAPFELPAGVAPRAAAVKPPLPARAPGLAWMLLLAFLGGVLLNAMP